MTQTHHSLVIIAQHILIFRGQKVMVDSDLANLYGVQTKVLVQAVKRNISRFPEDFMFQLTIDEFQELRSQSVTSSWGGRRYPPYVFTEQGVAMLSSVLNSTCAIAVNIEIMRAFVQLRETLATHKELASKLEALEDRMEAIAYQQDSFAKNTRIQLKQVFDALKQLMTIPDSPQRPIGFIIDEEKLKNSNE